MFRKKRAVQTDYEKENWKPILKCSICSGEQVAGFKNLHTGEFREETLICNEEELRAFMHKYGIADIAKEY